MKAGKRQAGSYLASRVMGFDRGAAARPIVDPAPWDTPGLSVPMDSVIPRAIADRSGPTEYHVNPAFPAPCLAAAVAGLTRRFL